MHFSNYMINTFHIHTLVLQVWFKRMFSLFFTTCWSCKPKWPCSNHFICPSASCQFGPIHVSVSKLHSWHL